MPDTWLHYWTAPQIRDGLARGVLSHIASNQFNRISAGDRVWVVSVRNGELITIGFVDTVPPISLEEARRLVDYEPWPGEYHILVTPATAQSTHVVSLAALAPALRFQGDVDRLSVEKGHLGHQLQTMRKLTQESAAKIGGVWVNSGDVEDDEGVKKTREALGQITRADVISAISDFTNGSVDHSFGPSRDYDLFFDGRLYPPKAIAGLATRRLLGRVPGPREFQSGLGSSSFRALGRTGFTIVARAGFKVPPEEAVARKAVAAAESELDATPGRQSFVRRPEARRAIEDRAMAVAASHFVSLGFDVRDCSRTESYDLHCTKGLDVVLVEVKGTTTPGHEVILTLNEAILAQNPANHMVLCICHGIALSEDGSDISASGGMLRLIDPWIAPPASLTPIAFRCTLSPEVDTIFISGTS